MATRPVFEFCIAGPFFSAQARRRDLLKSWRQRVSEAARLASGGRNVLHEAVAVRLVEFSERRTRDRDNLAKPILDALQGICFADDAQIADLAIEWRDIEGYYKVRFMAESVSAALSAGREFIWVRVFVHSPTTSLME